VTKGQLLSSYIQQAVKKLALMFSGWITNHFSSYNIGDMVTDVYGVGEVVISGEWRQEPLCAQRSFVNVWEVN